MNISTEQKQEYKAILFRYIREQELYEESLTNLSQANNKLIFLDSDIAKNIDEQKKAITKNINQLGEHIRFILTNFNETERKEMSSEYNRRAK
jgi:hypothetical protein